MPEQLWFTEILNHLFAGPVTGLLRALHIDPRISSGADNQRRWRCSFWCFCFWCCCSSWSARDCRWTSQAPCNTSLKARTASSRARATKLSGTAAQRFTPFLMTLAFFILLCNLLGLIPGFESPTAVPMVPLGCAVCAFIYYHAQGIRKKGVGHYAAHFLGPSDASMSLFIRIPLSILMLPIEIVSHLARSAFAHHPPLGEHVCRRSGHDGFLFHGFGGRAGRISGAAHRRVVLADIYFYPAHHGLSVGRGGGRTLNRSFQFRVSGFS